MLRWNSRKNTSISESSNRGSDERLPGDNENKAGNPENSSEDCGSHGGGQHLSDCSRAGESRWFGMEPACQHEPDENRMKPAPVQPPIELGGECPFVEHSQYGHGSKPARRCGYQGRSRAGKNDRHEKIIAAWAAAACFF